MIGGWGWTGMHYPIAKHARPENSPTWPSRHRSRRGPQPHWRAHRRPAHAKAGEGVRGPDGIARDGTRYRTDPSAEISQPGPRGRGPLPAMLSNVLAKGNVWGEGRGSEDCTRVRYTLAELRMRMPSRGRARERTWARTRRALRLTAADLTANMVTDETGWTDEESAQKGGKCRCGSPASGLLPFLSTTIYIVRHKVFLPFFLPFSPPQLGKLEAVRVLLLPMHAMALVVWCLAECSCGRTNTPAKSGSIFSPIFTTGCPASSPLPSATPHTYCAAG